MNRRQRRQMEKQLGLTKYKRSLSFNERIKQLSNSIAQGNEKQAAMKETVRRQEDAQSDADASNEIASLATTLVVRDGLSYAEALLKAREIYSVKKSEED